jgi:hypothetical protein
MQLVNFITISYLLPTISAKKSRLSKELPPFAFSYVVSKILLKFGFRTQEVDCEPCNVVMHLLSECLVDLTVHTEAKQSNVHIECIVYGDSLQILRVAVFRGLQIISSMDQTPRLLWNTKFHYRVHKGPPLVPISSQMNPVHIFHPVFLRSLLILFSHLRLDLRSGLFPSGVPTKILYAFAHLSHACYMLRLLARPRR